MILILSWSGDETTDIIIDELHPMPVFRWNLDLWHHYEACITNKSFRIKDPAGRVADEESVMAVYLRKLFFNPCRIDVPAGGSEEAWRRAELEAIWLGMRDLAHEQGKLALVHPASTGRWGKIRQMRVAQEYFRVPDWWVIAGGGDMNDVPPPVVAKTFTGTNIGGGLMPVQEVQPSRLSADYPWFLQSKMKQASHDVTVAWVDGELFAYQADRSLFQGEDVRVPSIEWEPLVLSLQEEQAISKFMKRTGYSFSRLDFLKVNGELWFLEVNPNGQFAWLDLDRKSGLIRSVGNAIKGVWEKNQALHSNSQ